MSKPHAPRSPAALAALTLGALGVVYGDIGTSPLYALRECFSPEYGLAPTPENVYGILSLILWALILVVTVKYIVFILQADNRGEGGILAMLALLLQKEPTKKSRRFLVIALGLMGAALLYGDGMITPAISVTGFSQGAMEGEIEREGGRERERSPASSSTSTTSTCTSSSRTRPSLGGPRDGESDTAKRHLGRKLASLNSV